MTPLKTFDELSDQIDSAVNKYGGPPKTTGPALNAVLKSLAGEITALPQLLGNSASQSARLGLNFQFLNLTERHYRFFQATTITRLRKDVGVDSLHYALNGGPVQAVDFDSSGEWRGTLIVPAGSLVAWSITYAAGTNEGNFELEGVEQIDPVEPINI